ncbi:hypothetical protein N9Q07_01900, partial [Alphaproteobacteria bacterium]|nr:hypothetical protein [Alphaproteobacteria bacterium]
MDQNINIDFEIISNLINNTVQIFVTYAGQVLGATIILILGFYFAGKLSKIARRNLSLLNKIDPLIEIATIKKRIPLPNKDIIINENKFTPLTPLVKVIILYGNGVKAPKKIINIPLSLYAD